MGLDMSSFLVENEFAFKRFYSLLVKNGIASYDFVYSLLESKSINTFNRVVCFFAQCSHESAGFSRVVENLNYSVDGLLRVFPRYFKTREFAEAYVSKKDRDVYIANRVYANRLGNGDELSGDGFRYRGRGYIQLTGKDNYKRFASYLGRSLDDDFVDYVSTVEGAFESAVWFWSVNDLNRFCDSNDFEGLTRAINGGLNGLDDRLSLRDKYAGLLSVLVKG